MIFSDGSTGGGGLALSVALARASTDNVGPQRLGRVEMEPVAVVDPHEVERVPLPQHVGPVTRDTVGRRIGRGPLSAEREVHDDRIVELAHLGR
jgi:hypothetical protein